MRIWIANLLARAVQWIYAREVKRAFAAREKAHIDAIWRYLNEGEKGYIETALLCYPFSKDELILTYNLMRDQDMMEKYLIQCQRLAISSPYHAYGFATLGRLEELAGEEQ